MKPRKWIWQILAGWLLLAGLLTAGVGHADGPAALVMQASGPLTPAMLNYTQRTVAQAAAEGDPVVVLQLNTPGGDVVLMQSIVQAIRTSKVPVIVFVGPRGAIAASAGTLVTLAGHLAAMAPETSIGAASPVGGSGQELDPTEARKTKNIIEASARDLTSRRGGKAVDLAVAAIEDARAVNATEAHDAGLIDFLAENVPDVLRQADGRTVTLQGNQQVTLHTANLPVSEMPMSWLEELGTFLVNPALISILFLVGAQAILIELANPGGWVPGVVGVLSLALAFYGLGTLPVNWLGLGLVAMSFLLFILDVKAPTHGALTAAGLAAMVAGFLVLFDSPGTPAYAQVSVPFVLALALITAAFFGFIVSRALQAQRRPTATGIQAVVGQRAQVRTRLDPTGVVFVHGERWAATVQGDAVDVGEMVQVVGVRGLQLLVRNEKAQIPPLPPAAGENGQGIVVSKIGE